MNEDQRLTARARALFHARADELDAVTTTRLAAARRRALDAAATPRPNLRRMWLPATAFASVAVIALGIGLATRSPIETPVPTSVEASELLLSDEDLAFFEEDAEFYDWAVTVADAG